MIFRNLRSEVPPEKQLADALNDERLAKFFKFNPGAILRLVSGERTLSRNVRFEKGTRWGEVDYAAWTHPRNRKGTYVVERDFEKYELCLTENGLTQTIFHIYRRGTEFVKDGPSDMYGQDIRRHVFYEPFFGDKDRLSGHTNKLKEKKEYEFRNTIETGPEALEYYSNLRLAKIARLIRRAAKRVPDKKVRSKTQNYFRVVGVTGIEKDWDGILRRLGPKDEVETVLVKNGEAVESSPPANPGTTEKTFYRGGGIIKIA